MREYTEKEYWDGLVPDELFEEYLNKYGYEYTPPVDRNERRIAIHPREDV